VNCHVVNKSSISECQRERGLWVDAYWHNGEQSHESKENGRRTYHAHHVKAKILAGLDLDAARFLTFLAGEREENGTCWPMPHGSSVQEKLSQTSAEWP